MTAKDMKDMLGHCFNMLGAFKKADEDSEIFLQRYLEDNRVLNSHLNKHITNIFNGCVKFDKVISIVVDAFYAKEGSTVLLSERHVYTVLTYIVLFYLDTLGLSSFKRLTGTQHVIRMHKFLNLLCDEHNLQTWMKEAWKRIYDNSFVETKLLEHAIRWLPELDSLIIELEDKISNAKHKSADSEDASPSEEKFKNATVVKPFDLTKPKPRAVPIPEIIPQVQKVRSPPVATYEGPKELDVIEEKRLENKMKAQALLDEANMNEFSCATASRTKPDKVVRRLEELKLEQEAKHSYRPPRMNPTPKSAIRSDTTIKLNTAAVLREKKFCEDVEREQLKKIEELENGAFSDAQYKSWKAAVDKQQAEVAQAEADRRLVEARLARELAELAHAEVAVDRRRAADDIKQDNKRRMKQFLAEKVIERAEMQKMVDQIIGDRGKIPEAQARLKEIKRKIVQEVSNESKELLAQALEEAESEMRKRSELIANIRALESVPLIRQKLFDRTELAGHGFLEEMSIAELEERMALAKASREKEIMEKQDAIVQEKREKQQKLTEAMDRIARHRMARSRVAAARKLKEAAEVDTTFLSLTTASTKAPTKPNNVDQKTAQRRAEIRERRAKITEQMKPGRTASGKTHSNSAVQQRRKFRDMMEEEHFKVFEKAQRKTDSAIGHGRRQDLDSLKLIYS